MATRSSSHAPATAPSAGLDCHAPAKRSRGSGCLCCPGCWRAEETAARIPSCRVVECRLRSAERRIRWGRRCPTLGDCMICTGTSGSFATICMGMRMSISFPVGLSLIPRGMQKAGAPRFAAAACTAKPGRAGRPLAAFTVPIALGASRLVSGLCWPQASPERERSGGARDERRLPAEGPRSQLEIIGSRDRGGPARNQDGGQGGGQHQLLLANRGCLNQGSAGTY
jgi:hypothetical protein